MRENKAAFCKSCKEIVPCTRNRVGHSGHLEFSFYTCGLWSPIWLLLTLTTDQRWKCDQCGGVRLVDNEPVATAELRRAKALIGKHDAAADRRLSEIMQKWPETQAAVTAEKLLDRKRK